MNIAQAATIVTRDSRPLGEQAYDLLVHKITRLELRPGALLVEKDLMAEFGIGRTPLREALQRLAIEGLVNHLPNRGMFVSEISAANVQHIYEFRTLIDGYAARLAAQRADDNDIRDIRRAHDKLVEAREAEDVDAYAAADREFYSALAHAAQNIYVVEVIPRIFNLHLRLWFFISSKRGSWRDIAKAHDEMTERVADAIERRDADDAELAIKVYISRRHQDIRDVL